MRRIVFLLAVMAVMVTVVVGGSALSQEIPPDKDGDPHTGCEGIWVGADQQDDGLPKEAKSPDPEPSAAPEVGDTHQCKTALPFNPFEPGQSGGQ